MNNGVLVDTDILIDVLRNFEPTIQRLAEVEEQSQLWVSQITQMELIVGCQDKRSLKKLEKFLEKFSILPINSAISDRTIKLLSQYRLSHGLLIPDAIIAATALVNQFDLLTKNQRDFRFIQNLELIPITRSPLP